VISEYGLAAVQHFPFLLLCDCWERFPAIINLTHNRNSPDISRRHLLLLLCCWSAR
jgi:hypothetical protein